MSVTLKIGDKFKFDPVQYFRDSDLCLVIWVVFNQIDSTYVDVKVIQSNTKEYPLRYIIRMVANRDDVILIKKPKLPSWF